MHKKLELILEKNISFMLKRLKSQLTLGHWMKLWNL